MKNTSWEIIVRKVDNFKMTKGITSFVNPYSMLVLEGNESIAQNVDNWCVDGFSLVKTFNIFEKKYINRFSFDDSSITQFVFDYSKTYNLTIAVIGTKEVFIHKAVQTIEVKFGIKVSYFRNGYFKNNHELDESINIINERNIDIVICGMGTPFQEDFLINLKNVGWKGYGFTCGGYLHQIATKENYYPFFFDKLNIRWIYRIIDEPKLIKRYFYYYPIFFIKYFKSILIR